MTIKLKKASVTKWNASASWVVAEKPFIEIWAKSGGGWNATDTRNGNRNNIVHNAESRKFCLELLEDRLEKWEATKALLENTPKETFKPDDVKSIGDKTITVAGHFGDKQMTKDAFVKQWTDHASQLSNISLDHYHEMLAVKNRVTTIAGMEWERLYAKQSDAKKVYGVSCEKEFPELRLTKNKDTALTIAKLMVQRHGAFSVDVFEFQSVQDAENFEEDFTYDWEVKMS